MVSGNLGKYWPHHCWFVVHLYFVVGLCCIAVVNCVARQQLQDFGSLLGNVRRPFLVEVIILQRMVTIVGQPNPTIFAPFEEFTYVTNKVYATVSPIMERLSWYLSEKRNPQSTRNPHAHTCATRIYTVANRSLKRYWLNSALLGSEYIILRHPTGKGPCLPGLL